MFAAWPAVNGGGVEKPPETVLPDRHLATVAGPIWEFPGVATVALACVVLGTPFWQYRKTLRLKLPERL